MEGSDRVAAVHGEDTEGAGPPVPTRRCQNNITDSHRPEPKQPLKEEGRAGGGRVSTGNPQLPAPAGATRFSFGYLSLKLRRFLDFTTCLEGGTKMRAEQPLAGERVVTRFAGDITEG